MADLFGEVTSSNENKDKIAHLVVDAAAFIKNVHIHDLADNVYTLVDVVREIKDRATKERLQVLPYDLRFQEPSADSIRIVTEFSKKTGDFPCLSATDIRVLALTYELHKQHIGTENIRSEPLKTINKRDRPVEKPGSNNLPGFYFPGTKHQNPDKTDIEQNFADDDAECIEEDRDCDDDERGWLAADNVRDAIESMGLLSVQCQKPAVACITTDFAMQNTLLQMGLNVISVDGLLIKSTKTFILRCFGCFKTTTKMTCKFCPHCGNKTLKRISVTVDDDGQQRLNLAFRRPINIRGTRYQLPMPNGGKHSNDPIVCADQPIPQNRPSKLAMQRTDALNPDYGAAGSPFAVHDVYSRASNLGIRATKRNNQRNSDRNSGKRR